MAVTFEITGGQMQELPAGASLPHGSYTTLRTYGRGRVVCLREHVRRLEESAAALGMTGQIDPSALRAALGAAVEAAGYPESRLRVSFAPPRLFVSVEPFEPLPPVVYQEGVACITVPVRRDNPQTKDTHYLVTARRVYESLPSGIHEGLLLSEDGALLEGLSSNFFAVREGVLHTEPRRALHGITRALVLEAAGGLLPLATTAARIDQLPELSECFITSTSRGILPVVLIDDVHIGQGRPGEITRTLASRFDALVEREAEALFA